MRMRGAAPVQLVAKRRTAIIVDPPQGIEPARLPAMDFADCDGHIKPEAGRLMASPGSETPVEPQDVQPEEWDVAVLAAWFQKLTHIEVRRVQDSWADLRTFVSDDTPVVVYDPDIKGFFWLVGQGGCGIMMALALGRAAVHLITNDTLPDDLASLGVPKRDFAPERFGIKAN